MGLQFSSDEIQSPVKTSSSQSSFENARRETGALSLKDRAKAAIVGAFVADSLSSYSSNCDENDETKFLSNFEEQEQIFGTHNKVEPSPHSGHLGHQSFYGEEAFPFLRIISTRGYFESTDACEEAFQLLTVFKEKDSAHLNVHPLMKEFYDRRIEGCSWVDCSCGNDLNFLSITKVPILVARYAGSPFLLSKVEDAVRIYQTNPKVLAACRLSAILLEKVVLGYSVSDALQWAIESAERKNKPSSGGSKERNSISNLSVQNQFSLITLDENEIEFLYAILPIPEKIPYMHSNYGSCQTLDPAFQNNSDINESSRGDSKYDCQSDTYGSELRMEVGAGMKKSGSKNKISRNSSGNSIGSNGSTDPSGAFNYYLQNNSNNSDNNSNNTQSNKEINGRPIHRRLLCGGMSGINGSRSVPFSSAVEQIGLSAQLPESLQASLYGLHIFRSYETAVRANIMTGGDNVCRSWLIGAMFAAEQGESCIPTEWTQQTLLHSQIVTMADRLAGSNPYFETLKEKGCNISVLLS